MLDNVRMAREIEMSTTGLDMSDLCFWHQVYVRESGHLIYGLILQCSNVALWYASSIKMAVL